MKKWKQKAIVQKIISYLPFSRKINFLFQKYVTKGVTLSDEYFYDRLGHVSGHIKSYQQYAENAIPANCLEIGTGWYPIVPISFFLIGASKIYSVDISLLTSKERLQTTLQKFVESNNAGKLNAYINFLPERFETLTQLVKNYDQFSLNDALQELNITYLIEDARRLSLSDNSIDLINSNNTFEHIYPNILISILAEFKRVANKKNGVMSHFIDMTDHFAHFDKSINCYNFLQFEDKKWRWIDNSIQPQNRMRMYEYQKIFADLKIPITSETYDGGRLDELKSISIAEKYAAISLEEIAKTYCHFISVLKNSVS